MANPTTWDGFEDIVEGSKPESTAKDDTTTTDSYVEVETIDVRGATSIHVLAKNTGVSTNDADVRLVGRIKEVDPASGAGDSDDVEITSSLAISDGVQVALSDSPLDGWDEIGVQIKSTTASNATTVKIWSMKQ